MANMIKENGVKPEMRLDFIGMTPDFQSALVGDVSPLLPWFAWNWNVAAPSLSSDVQPATYLVGKGA